MKRILFSPIGSTDPIKNCHDGACLHIVRHYQPERVVLFFTKEMGESEHNDHRYTIAIKQVAPDCIIEPPIYTDIVDPSRYEAFSRILPQAVAELLEKYPEHEILLNLSSGTPQIKTILAILAADNDRCVGIQTVTPVRAANDHKVIMTEKEIQELIESNYDNEPETASRLEEPPLGVFRYYAERSRILSLIASYEYAAALKIAHRSALVPIETKQLLRHAAKRSMLLTEEAKESLREYNGKKLFPFDRKTESLVEYFLLMQIDQETGRLSNLMLRMIPFLYEFLRDYTNQNVKLPLRALCDKRYLSREKLAAQEPELLAYLNRELGGYRDTELSFYLLYLCCVYAGKVQRVHDAALHTALLAALEKITPVRKLRNDVAHEMTNVTETLFHQRMNMSAQKIVSVCAHMLVLVYGEKLRTIRTVYRDINEWIEKSLEIHA